jgi:phosphatidylserine synthase 2
VSLIELNAFYLKYILWVPPPHPLNIIRLCLWLFMGLPALREYYQFVSDPYAPNSPLVLFIIL